MSMDEKVVSRTYIRNKTIISLTVFTLFIVGCITTWKWLYKQPKEQGALGPVRQSLNANEFIFGSIYSISNLSKTFPKKDAAKNVRVNGNAGMSNNFDTAAWTLRVIKS
ncbi:MAG: hypothetical protein H7X88_06090, partial [Gloeobacteraceae cyanobacterium ES-bin-316]|nr:hypothetical protein [Ferruginibacter sp.]